MFLKDRFISENNLTTAGVIEHASKTQEKGIMLAIDFSKAFDCLDHQFIQNVLLHFGFGRTFVAYIRTMLTGFTASILHAGNISRAFKLGRGARQGDPLASLLFIACVEILSIRLKEDPAIQHYEMDGVKVKLILYADDLNLFMKKDEN